MASSLSCLHTFICIIATTDFSTYLLCLYGTYEYDASRLSMQHNYTVDLVIHDQLQNTATIPGQLQQISARAQLLLDGKFLCHGTCPVPSQF